MNFPTYLNCKNKDLSVIHIFTNNIQKHSVYVHLICFSLHESFMIFFSFLTVCDENTTEHSSWSSQNKSSSHQRASVTLSKNNNIYRYRYYQSFLLRSYLVSYIAFKWQTINYTPHSNSYCHYTANDLVAHHFTLASRSAPSISSPLRLQIKSAWLRPGWIREKFSQWCFVYDIDIQYEAPIWIVSANLESPRPMAVQCAFGAEIFFGRAFGPLNVV